MTKKDTLTENVSSSSTEATDINYNRRKFLAGAAVASVSAGAGAFGMVPSIASAVEQGEKHAKQFAPQPLEVNSKMAKWKNRQPLEFVEGATKRFSFPNVFIFVLNY